MKRRFKIAAWFAFVLFAAIQLYQPALNKDGGKTYETDFLKAYNAPAAIGQLFKASCYDCHSNNTNYLWYDHIQPVRLLVENHIREAKDELNFNEWSNYSKRKQERLLASVSKQIATKKMPLPSYVWMHKDAALTDADIKKMTDWLEQVITNPE